MRDNERLAVIYLDLDGFKTVNDVQGHGQGDALLVALARRMGGVLRQTDTLARIGGDEFVAVLTDLAADQDAQPWLERLLRAANEPVRLAAGDARVSASLGVTFYPQAEPVDADQLLRQADHALDQVKLAGKNRHHVYGTRSARWPRAAVTRPCRKFAAPCRRGSSCCITSPK